MSDFHGKPNVPATVADLDLAFVVEVLARYACNIADASKDLGVPPNDLRRLLWANPKVRDQAFEVVEGRLDTAEKNITETLNSGDSRRRDAASFFVLRRNSAGAKRRGWIVSASGVSINTGSPPRRWRTDDAERAEAERLREEGKQVTSIGWGDPPDDAWKLIEHEASLEP